MLQLDVYQKNLAALLLICGTLLATRSSTAKAKGTAENKSQDVRPNRDSQWAFYVVYALVMASDWLQGPYLYSLYRDEHYVPPHLIPTLFTTGFLSGALFAYFAGSIADRSGRRRACLVFCAAYALSCALTTVPSLPLLFAGRVLGGLGTSLLFSAFESWMVADFHKRFLGQKGLDLGRTFGTMGTVNGVVAIASGVLSEWLVERTGTRKAPFVVSIGLLGLAAFFIYGQWDENYGETSTKKEKTDAPGKSKLRKALTDRRVLALGLASTMFEGSMYLFVFFWAPALETARYVTNWPPTPLPYGTVFASFMASTMVASLLFTRTASSSESPNHKSLLSGLLAVSTVVFYALYSAARSEQATFWLFCVFEACVGLYWPCIGVLRGRVVDEAVRAQVYGVLRIPLNVFVVGALTVTGGGGEYTSVFGACAGFLLLASVGLTMTAV